MPQLARAAGCTAIGVVGNEAKKEVASQLGAHEVIDRSTEDLWRLARRHAPDGYDAIFDANGVATLRESYEHLASRGRLVVYGFHTGMLSRGRGTPNWPKLAVDWARTPRFDPLRMTNENRSVMAFNLSYLFERKASFVGAMESLLEWVEQGSSRSSTGHRAAFGRRGPRPRSAGVGLDDGEARARDALSTRSSRFVWRGGTLEVDRVRPVAHLK